MLEEISSPDRVESWVKDKLARHEKIMGFGHRVYKTGDSRVPAMRELARDMGERVGETHWVPICEKLEAVMDREKKLCANVDLYAAVLFRLIRAFDREQLRISELARRKPTLDSGE